jgi:tyrosine-specific transport protein
MLVEANLWMEEGAHLMTMASRLLGRGGKYLTVLLYLFMGYGSLVAYNSGGGSLIENAANVVLSFPISRIESCTIFAVVFGAILYTGTKTLGRINAILVIGMVIAYFTLIGMSLGKINTGLLQFQNWKQSFFAIPLVLTTFSYQMIVPSLTPYLKRDPHALRKAVFIGTTIPFLIYAIWQGIVLGTVPVGGEGGLAEAFREGATATQSLRVFIESPYLALSAECFAFFALVTSYLGIALGMFDFIADAFKMNKRKLNKFWLGQLIIIPSLIFAAVYPRAFLIALELTGGFGDTILNGLLPIAMIYAGRYRKRIEGPYEVNGGKFSLLAIGFFACAVIIIQLIKL